MARLKLKPPPFKWAPFSVKQIKVLTWWMQESPHHDMDALICDGSVRAGKTVAMSFSFVTWAMETFVGEQFAMAGKTIGALRRNVVGPLKRMLASRGYYVHDNQTDNVLTISRGLVANHFFLFGGKDERSQDLIQGITLAGIFLDEVALMPESFVSQAVARCSVEGRKYWFNCNPAGPYHWFKVEWLDKAKEKRALHLHFTMDDNLSLSERVKEGYRRLFSGVFYKRYILGLWVMAEGVIYDVFDEDKHKLDPADMPAEYSKFYVGVDYGHTNATVFLLLGEKDGRLYVIKEYYHSDPENPRAPSDYARDFVKFIAGIDAKKIYIDPSAKGFITELKKLGVRRIEEADNSVLPGIESVAVALKELQLFVCSKCKETLKEFFSYVWDEKAAQDRGEDKPVKKYDHAMDALRYVIYAILGKPRRSMLIT
ncbi:PBSX family phage terminase large subunit [Paenibacillus graminis]|uniref:PBSX family phage terminase large subunit n=1 Tax=Paenibacillus graminis TaxID=189425 RepID=UPI002DBA60FC|nr:PBSX family phage terminase large subunit [Paenibacillus graminis]MEC0169902.1 PBSX family phage terminase large subunit [Paenibacillus graminis]